MLKKAVRKAHDDAVTDYNYIVDKNRNAVNDAQGWNGEYHTVLAKYEATIQRLSGILSMTEDH